MKKLILTFVSFLCLICVNAQSPCTPLPYQDSLYAIWPDTVDNLPVAYQGQNYSTTLTFKTPSTLIEAVGGDSSLVDIPGLGYIGDAPVNSMELLSVSGLPNGFDYECAIPDCNIPGNTLTCAELSGSTTDPIGVYPVIMNIRVHTTVMIQAGPIQIPIDTSQDEQIYGYRIVLEAPLSNPSLDYNKYELMQNTPNPSSDWTRIEFNAFQDQYVHFFVTDIFGRVVFNKDMQSQSGVNSFLLNTALLNGIYQYSITDGNQVISKRMVVLN